LKIIRNLLHGVIVLICVLPFDFTAHPNIQRAHFLPRLLIRFMVGHTLVSQSVQRLIFDNNLKIIYFINVNPIFVKLDLKH